MMHEMAFNTGESQERGCPQPTRHVLAQHACQLRLLGLTLPLCSLCSLVLCSPSTASPPGPINLKSRGCVTSACVSEQLVMCSRPGAHVRSRRIIGMNSQESKVAST